MNVLITGLSSGIGLGLARAHLTAGDTVFGLSRRPPTEDLPSDAWSFASVDLTDFDGAKVGVTELLADVKRLDLVWLNAGKLGALRDMADASIEEMQETLDLNVWGNKVVLDVVFDLGIDVGQVVAVSSGAAVNGNRGWSGYAISKAALNMLIQLYAAERLETHFAALAPGLVDTAMQDHICGLPANQDWPSLDILKSARGTKDMPGPDEAAKRMLASVTTLATFASGSFADIRLLLESKK